MNTMTREITNTGAARHTRMSIGVIKTSFKENERRLPIHPEHLSRLPVELRRALFFEKGYGADYQFSDEFLGQQSGGVRDREALFGSCDIILLPKPVVRDLEQMRAGQVLFGWPHCVQQVAITQCAIDRRLTVIAWEAMHHWSSQGEKLMHLFYKNNEIAGYAAVLHVLQLLGIDGHYGPRRKVVVLGYGSVSRGVIYALQGRGFNNIHVFTKRPSHWVGEQNPDVYHGQYVAEPGGEISVIDSNGDSRLLIEELSEADIICNGILQDTNAPVTFVQADQLHKLKPRSVVIDVSCDKGIGFCFACPTTFEEPTFSVGDHITYYSVDHTPSYLWSAATREISKAVIPVLPTVAEGPEAWKDNETVRRAIEIHDGTILNCNILSYQRRAPEYPHLVQPA